MPGPLEGIRVLDLTRILAGPYCSMILGDMGCEVIKIEKPEGGDDTRAWGPPFIEGESGYFICVNRNKKSLTLNLKNQTGREILKKLANISDVLIENFSPGTMEDLGLGWDVLSKLNPKLVYCSITGFGPTGPFKDKLGYDMVISAIGGLMSITGEEDGNPVKVGVAITDVLTGLFACCAIVSALFSRNKTGEGQRIDLSLLETQVAALINIASSYLISGKIPKKWGTAHESIVPYQAFKAKDKHFAICVGNENMWARFCKVLQIPELTTDPRFKTNPKRVENRKELIKILSELFEKKEASHWISLLDSVSIPAGPINNIEEVFKHPQVLHRNMLVEVPHPKAGNIKMVGIPVKFQKTKSEIRFPPPLLGEHTFEILSSLLGYSQDIIEDLKKNGVT